MNPHWHFLFERGLNLNQARGNLCVHFERSESSTTGQPTQREENLLEEKMDLQMVDILLLLTILPRMMKNPNEMMMERPWMTKGRMKDLNQPSCMS